MMIRYQQIEPEDYLFLRKILYEALFIPMGEKPFPVSIIDLPEISKYIDNWETTKGFGLIALVNDVKIGAVWAQIFEETNKGYGFVDEKTPELSMAIFKEYRNMGIGTKLLNEFFKFALELGYQSLSLSVDKRNPASKLYKREGFKVIDELPTAYTMIKYF